MKINGYPKIHRIHPGAWGICSRRISVTGEHKEIIRDSEEWKESSMNKWLSAEFFHGMVFIVGKILRPETKHEFFTINYRGFL